MSDDPYSTHLPVLKGLKPKPKRVLEFGAGWHSTKAFLAMDGLTELVSVEQDPEWRGIASKEYKDKRWTLLDGKRIPPLTDFDLIFIDDGGTQQDREETIRYVLRQDHPKVVIHDADVYEPVIREFSDKVTIHDGLTPHTAVVAAT